jgi:hypothetical protein
VQRFQQGSLAAGVLADNQVGARVGFEYCLPVETEVLDF